MADKKTEQTVQNTEGMLGSYDANGNYVDPYGVTFYDGFTGKNLNNADTEKSAYGDDSTLATYNTGNNKGGTNDKYTGENTRNTYTGYNADIKTADLDPDYQYGGLAQQQESIDNSYIANRNDNIASALYNEGRRSIEDVADFLNQQAGFQNSTAEQRQNTINSVWKRIGQIEAENQKNNEQPADPNKTPEGEKNEALNNMESDLNKSTAGELYGKVTADQSTAIKTLEDENSVYRSMNASRIQTFKNLQSMDSNSIASAIISGAMATDTQAMRDLMQYDPAKYQEVKQAEKQIRGQMNINTITSGEGDFNTVATNGQSGISNEITDFASNNSNGTTSTADILKSVNSSLSSNQSAATASEQMATIEADMATLQNRMKNLKKEASTVFKGDVPQYIVNAYIANRTAEIQDQLSILENRYNAAYSRYQQEWEQTKWNAEFGLKQQELQLKRESMALNSWATQQGIDIQWAELAAKYNSGGTITTPGGISVPTTSMTQEEIGEVIDSLVEQCTNGKLGNAQCAAGVQKNYFSRIGIEISNLSSWERKKAICTDLASSGYVPKKGDVIVLDTGACYTDSNGNKVEAGHMGIVVGVEGDTLRYLDWNGSVKNGVGTEKAAIRTIKLNNSKIYGYYDPTKGQSQGGGREGDSGWKRNDGTSFNLSGSPVYNSLDEKSREAVKQLLNNNISKSSVSKRTGYEDAEGIFAAVNQINPLWSETDYNNRKTAENNWAKLEQGGATSRNATAVSTAKRIYDLVDGLTDKDLAKTDIKTINELINTAGENIGNTKVVELKTLLNGLQSETAGALKGGNAAISDKDKQDMEAILNVALSKNQLKTAMEAMVKLLYDKNETEAKAIYNYGFYKKKPIWTDESVEWMNNDLGIDMSVYYDYKPSGTGKKTAGGYAPKFDEDIYNASSIGDLL